MNSLHDNYLIVKQRLTEALSLSGRKEDQILLVAVTKTHPPQTVTEARELGLFHYGENKVQETKTKKEFLGGFGHWHLIGHLQSNKAKLATQLFDWIESVDSLELAQDLSRFAVERSQPLKVLIQINISGEISKTGIHPGKALELAERINALPRLELRGLMTMAPFSEDPETARPVFAGLRELRDRVETGTGLHLPDLSMGMSQDYTVAAEEGSTILRLGTALFGHRSKPIR